MVMGGGCLPGSEIVVGLESEVLARTLKNWDGEEGRTPTVCDSLGRKESPWNGRWIEIQSKLAIFAKCGPFSSFMLNQI